MSDPKTHYTAKELAGLPGLPGTEQAVNYRARSESWANRKRAGRGGGREYPLTALPAATREHLLGQLIEQKAPAASAAVPQLRPAQALQELPEPQIPAVATLKKWQRDTMDARIYFMRLIEEAGAHGIGITEAIRTLAAKSVAAELPPESQAMVALANKRSGTDTKKRALSERSLTRWWGIWTKGNRQAAVLAPKSVERDELPAWAPYFLQAYRVPQKISIPHALEDMAAALPEGIAIPTEAQVRHFLKKYSKLDVHRGRMTGKELKSQKGFIRRDTSELLPLDVCLCDGHSFKAYVAHPVHGRPFHPEVCGVIDAATRVCIGWSTGLAESSQTVADAYRHAVTIAEDKPVGGIPAILYADKGAGNEAAINADPYVGMYARLGSTYKTGIPGNSQARGLIERMQGSMWVRAAKSLPTYTGHGMDEGVRRKVYLTLEKDVKQAVKAGKEGKKSDLLISWQEFVTYFLPEAVDAYNRRPHKSLPRITDPQTGERRHMCPLEMWATFLANGWKPEAPTPAELDSLFRPHVTVTARRGEVRLFGNIYYDANLVHYNGQQVIVAYDIHDADHVWVKDLDERLICVARFEANKRAFYPVSAVEQAREDRKNRRKRTLERHLEEVEAESRPAVEVLPLKIELPEETIEFKARKQAEVEARQKAATKLVFMPETDLDVYRALCAAQDAGEPMTERELTWMEDYRHWKEHGKKRGLHKQGFEPWAERMRRQRSGKEGEEGDAIAAG